MRSARSTVATDPRDKIFSVLGFPDECDDDNLVLESSASSFPVPDLELGRELLSRTMDEAYYLGITDEGCDVPVLLRRVGGGGGSDGGGQVEGAIDGSDGDRTESAKSACFVNGLMFGEGLDSVSGGDFRDFEIR